MIIDKTTAQKLKINIYVRDVLYPAVYKQFYGIKLQFRQQIHRINLNLYKFDNIVYSPNESLNNEV